MQRKHRCSSLRDHPSAFETLSFSCPRYQLTNLSTIRIDEWRNLGLQQVQCRSKCTAKGLASQKIRYDRQREFVKEADKLGRVQEVFGVIGAAGDVAEVDASEGVYFARVAADRNSFGDDGGYLYNVLGERQRSIPVGRTEGAAVPEGWSATRLCVWYTVVPIIRDTLISWGPRQRAVGCFCDREEGFESLFV